MTDLDTGHSSIRDDSICESSLPPNKSSGDIVERLRAPRRGCIDDIVFEVEDLCMDAAAEIERLRRELEAANNNHRSMAHLLAETGIRLEATKREVESLQRALLFWMPGVDLRLDEATRERAAQDAGLLAGYTEPLDGPCWGDGMLDRALTAESAVAAAWEEAADAVRKCASLDENGYICEKSAAIKSIRASAIRAAVSKKTAESGHSPSTHNSESE